MEQRRRLDIPPTALAKLRSIKQEKVVIITPPLSRSIFGV
jgi:hypothetical protein